MDATDVHGFARRAGGEMPTLLNLRLAGVGGAGGGGSGGGSGAGRAGRLAKRESLCEGSEVLPDNLFGASFSTRPAADKPRRTSVASAAAIAAAEGARLAIAGSVQSSGNARRDELELESSITVKKVPLRLVTRTSSNTSSGGGGGVAATGEAAAAAAAAAGVAGAGEGKCVAAPDEGKSVCVGVEGKQVHGTTQACEVQAPTTMHDVMPWQYLCRYAARPLPIGAPCRAEGETTLYDKYKRWLVAHEVSNPDYIRRYVGWSDEDVALEPNLVPYNVAEGIEHWTLWFNDRTYSDVPSVAEVNRHLLACVPGLAAGDFQGGLSVETDADAAVEAQPETITSSCVWYENHPMLKSIPEIVHLHVFIRRENNEEVGGSLDRMREAWVKRSPFLQDVEGVSGRAGDDDQE